MVARNGQAFPAADFSASRDTAGRALLQSMLQELEQAADQQGTSRGARRRSGLRGLQQPLDTETVVRKLIEVLRRDS